MYTYLSIHGECYYIQYRGKLVGDASLRDDGEVCIFVCREYQNLHIGRRCIADMLTQAREQGKKTVTDNIYRFNLQSRKMFEAVGFQKTAEEWFVYRLEAE